MNTNHFNKFTKEAKQALVVAQEEARKAKLNYVGTEHVLLGILSQEGSLGASILSSFGVSFENVVLVLKTVGRINAPVPQSKAGTGLSGYAKQIIEDAVRCGHEFGHDFIGTEHLLFSLVSQKNTAAIVILENMKVSAHDIRNEIVKAFESGKAVGKGTAQNAKAPSPQMMNNLEVFLSGLQGVLSAANNGEKTEAYKKKQESHEQDASKTPALDYFTTDLTAECRKAKLDPVIGRNKEIQRITSILCRKTKNNPVLIGEPGVGKTAIVEGLAQRIVLEQVPDSMLDKKILSLSMASVVAGTKYRGEFEERIKQIVEEASTQPNVILFIDELHTVIGAGSAEGSLDAANILKPALSRGKVQVVGATTTTEYRKHIEEDAALERRFQSVMVDEPSTEDAVEMLRGLRESFEDHHSLIITDEAIVSAVNLSKRYINDRFLPDKAIDLIDEACSLKRITSKSNMDKVKKLQKELDKVVNKKEKAVTDQNYELAADLRNKELDLAQKIDEQRIEKIPRSKRKKIGSDNVAEVISTSTGIPVTSLVSTEVSRLMGLESTLKKHIIGQDEAVEAISKAIRRSRSGFADENRPIGSFMFLGPTGVGKTELVKRLAAEVFNDRDALIKIDMSEFMERHNVSRLVGATAGYVGYEDGGQLTEAVRRKPYSVLLFDEVEKAHPDVFNLLLQILEDGYVTDSKGRKVDFRNTIIIMTSNIGADKLTESAASIGFDLAADELEEAEAKYEAQKELIMEDLKRAFRPEFLNRVDKVVVFKALTHENINKIVKLHVTQLEERLRNKSISLKLTKTGLDKLSELSYDPHYGARPVRRAIQDLVEDPLTHLYLEGKVKDGDTIKIVKDGDTITVQPS